MDFAVDVFNRDGVVIDAKNYIYPQGEANVPEKWPDGTPAQNANVPMSFVPPDPKSPKFIPPQ